MNGSGTENAAVKTERLETNDSSSAPVASSSANLFNELAPDETQWIQLMIQNARTAKTKQNYASFVSWVKEKSGFKNVNNHSDGTVEELNELKLHLNNTLFERVEKLTNVCLKLEETFKLAAQAQHLEQQKNVNAATTSHGKENPKIPSELGVSRRTEKDAPVNHNNNFPNNTSNGNRKHCETGAVRAEMNGDWPSLSSSAKPEPSKPNLKNKKKKDKLKTSEVEKADGHGPMKKAHQVKGWYYCQCGIKYINKRKLYQHIRHFAQEKKFPCNQCNEKFLRLSYLRQHVIKTHSTGKADPTFEISACRPCGQVFYSKKEFEIHKDSKHAQLVPLHDKQVGPRLSPTPGN